MSKATGQVAVVYGKDGKFGKMWSLKVEGDDTWYGCKSVKPDTKEGDQIEFNWSNNKRGYPDIDLDTLVVLEAGDDAPEKEAAGESSDKGGNTAGRKAYDRKQAVIVYQNAGNRAIELISLAYKAEILDLPKKGTIADKYAALRLFVDMATNDFYYEAMDVYAGNEPGSEDA